MIKADLLRTEFDRSSPDLGKLEIQEQTFMDLYTEVSDCALSSGQDDWGIVVWNLTLELQDTTFGFV